MSFILTADTLSSALTIVDGDTIDLAGFRLTIDQQETAQNVTVETPGTPGTVTIGGAWDLSTWSFVAGTGVLIATNPAGAILGNATGGTASLSIAVNVNQGHILDALGGSDVNALGINGNSGICDNATGGTVANAHGVNVNSGDVGVSVGGGDRAYGIRTNTGTVLTAQGGGVNRSYGINLNSGTVHLCIGGSVAGAYGVNSHTGTAFLSQAGSAATTYGVSVAGGQVFATVDTEGRAVNQYHGSVKFIKGPEFRGEFVTGGLDPTTTIYVLDGPLHADAVIPDSIEIINAFGGGSTAPQQVRRTYVLG